LKIAKGEFKLLRGNQNLYFSTNQGHNSRTGKVVKSEIKTGLLFMIRYVVYKIQMICYRETYARVEIKFGSTDRHG